MAKPAMFFFPPEPSDIIKSGPDSITHSTPTQHFMSFVIILLTLFQAVFDLICIRRLRNEVHPFLLVGLFSIASVIICPV